MSYRTRAQAKTEVANIKSLNAPDGKIDAVELSQVNNNFVESAEWNDTPQTLTSSTSITWDVTNTREANLSLAHNAALTITGLPTDGRVVYGNCRVVNTGSFTLSMPSGAKVAGGSIMPSAVNNVSFRYDGTNLDITIGQYL